MNYLADFGLLRLINQHKRKTVNNVLFGLFMVVSTLIYMYFVGDKKLDFIMILCMMIFLVTMGFILYNQIVPKGEILNNTVTSITIQPNCIRVETAAFNILFLANNPSKELVFDTEKLNVRIGSYPLKSVFDLDNRILKLTDKDKEVYIIADYFAPKLKEELTKIC